MELELMPFLDLRDGGRCLGSAHFCYHVARKRTLAGVTTRNAVERDVPKPFSYANR
jgi:hypothetical protein